jgi:hypothetical protein
MLQIRVERRLAETELSRLVKELDADVRYPARLAAEINPPDSST